MSIVIVIAIVVAMGGVLFALIRGLVTFLKTTEADLKGGNEPGAGTSEMHAMQNRMMFARVKWQAIAVLLLVVLSLFAAAN
ncbi:MAG: hypothetical protein GW859_04280 [Sphingomonadales bacterium]|nr:hypothetical protein [Sphingomonadales bacterium]